MTKSPKLRNSKPSTKKKIDPKILVVDQKITVEELREKFPNLYSELTEKKKSLGIDQVEDNLTASNLQEDSNNDLDPFSNYDPDIYDFLSRAKKDEDGIEIINFLEKENQISSNTAEELRKKIITNGIRSIGPLRDSNYYFRRAAEIRSKKTIQKRYSSPPKNKTEN